MLMEPFIGRRVDSCLRNVALLMVATQDRQRSPAATSFPPDASFSPIYLYAQCSLFFSSADCPMKMEQSQLRKRVELEVFC